MKKLGLESASFPVATIGGVFAAGKLVTDSLAEAIRQVAPLARIGPAAHPPEMGAIRLALARGREGLMSDSRALVTRLHEADRAVSGALGAALPAIARAADSIAERLEAGGRWFYAGAGTSGRLGALDAAELPPTFGTDPSLVVALLAGGRASMFEAVEGAEDDADAGGRDLVAAGLTAKDAVVGIAASGATPYVIGALEQAKRAGALTVAVVCRPGRARSRNGGHRHPPRHRKGSPRRVQPPEGRNRAEDRPQHALDGRHGEARPRLPGRDGRDAADEREAAEARDPHRPGHCGNVRRERRRFS